MKKFFTLIAAVAMAASVNAQGKLIDFPTSKTGITLHSVDAAQIVYSTVKIHQNKDVVDCIKVGKSFSSNETVVDNFIELTTDGGFKAGDVVAITGVFNNSDGTKTAAIAMFTGGVGEKPNTYFKTDNFINGRTSADDPVEQTFTLDKDLPNLQLGRNGNTAASVIKLTVVRSGTSGISNINASEAANEGATFNLLGQKVASNAKGLVIKNGKKFINK